MYGVANWTLRKLDEEYIVEKINLADRMRDEEVEEERNILHTGK